MRMNSPKQLLQFKGKTLLRRAVETAIESVCNPVIVVLGANFEMTKAAIEDLPVEIVFNQDWQRGLSSSIKIGLETLLRIAPKITAVMMTLADQPFVTFKHLNSFAERFHRSNDLIIAAEYNLTTGVPALFARDVLADFNELSGDKGARSILENYRQSLATLKLPEAAFDIDTPKDLLKLKQTTFGITDS